ncbi:T9SS type A sorting domain-containing protein [Epilithonimonas arachidiradicis]|uniref:Putative secreted protein (Por secretion system target) n=1 Tax=Epilithonimonas arachidiradicis TaxID=1617282 RepID=A0A420CKP9_9FLAO|nr:T9SS type A sorting domain-containing protein [Epilithonimonas arachidiradicis]RKE79119.1 putative secreted protein (Por secretion system target) [Epilithonimonas arachidiradicis]GGG60389.1 hypothetical protein GCM10007332_22560 [Epilithonimonas arachidiradicis]
MNNKILTFVFGIATLLSNAQVMLSGDLNDLTSGDVGTNFTGQLPGQDGFYLQGGSAPDYQIVEIDADHGKSFQIKSGLDGTSSSIRLVTKSYLDWRSRKSGNNIIRGKIDIYTGNPVGGAAENQFRCNITGNLEGTLTTGVLAGVHYNYKDGKIYGQATMKNGNTYSLHYFALGNMVIPKNTWITLSYYYNEDTGQVNWVTPNGNFFTNISTSVVTGFYPTHFNIAYMPDSSSQLTTAYTSAFDNYFVEAMDSTALSVGTPIGDNDVVLKIFPNPVKEKLYIHTKSPLKNVEIRDFSGKLLKNLNSKSSSEIDLKSLKNGVYLITVKTENNVYTDRIIKQ